MAGLEAARFTDLLRELLSSEASSRQQAMAFYQQAVVSEPQRVLLGLLTSLASRNAEPVVRHTAAVLTRQLMTPAGDTASVFGKLDQHHRQEIAGEVLRLFRTETNEKLQPAVGNIICKIVLEACEAKDQQGWLFAGECGWPALLPEVFQMANPATNQHLFACTSAIRLFIELVAASGTKQMVSNFIAMEKQKFIAMLHSGLTHADARMCCECFLLICEIVMAFDRQAWTPLLIFMPLLLSTMQQLHSANLPQLQKCLKASVDVALTEPHFFKLHLGAELQPAKFLATIAQTRNGTESGTRVLALEWLVTYTERQPKWLAKSLPDLPLLTLEACMKMMLEVDDSEDLKDWADRMERDDEAEDANDLFLAGEQAVGRTIGAMTMDHIGASFFSSLQRFVSHDSWQAKHAALAAIKQTVEHIDKLEHMNQMAKLLLAHADHAHPRVQYIALHALGHLGVHQAPQFQDGWHSAMMSMFLRKIDEPVICIAEMAMVAFVAFAEMLDKALMMDHAREFMQAFGRRLLSGNNRNIQQQCITSIAVIAGSISDDFTPYYHDIMPVLTNIVKELPASEKSGKILRGKAFECMSVIGVAVGKDKFLPDVNVIVSEMMKTSLGADDEQREYIIEASQRICRCLKSEFAPYLPVVLPGLLAGMRMAGNEVSSKSLPSSSKRNSDESSFLKRGAIAQMSSIRGPSGVVKSKVSKVRTDKFEHVLQCVRSVLTFCTEMEEAFFDYVPQTAEALLPFLEAAEDTDMLCDEVRSAAFQAWAALIDCACTTTDRRRLHSDLPRQLLHTFLQKTCLAMLQDSDPESLRDAADGIASCLRRVGDDMLKGPELLQLADMLFSLIDQSFQRSRDAEIPNEIGGSQLDEDDRRVLDDEDICRRGYEEALGAAIKAALPEDFLPCLPECARRMAAWLATNNKILAFWLACDLLEHLQEHSQPLWSTFMPHVFQAFGQDDSGVLSAAALAIYWAAPLEGFEAAAPEAFKVLAKVISAPAPGPLDDKAQLAMDGCVAALMALLRAKASCCPPDVQAWQLVISKLPLKAEEAEAQHMHGTVADLVLEQHVGLLGPGQSHLGQILCALAEVHRQEDLCDARTDAKIQKIFTMLPADVLQQLSSTFTEKQRKKIELILKSKLSV